ncbi:MAG: T9SS type A sorting domain-containing protein [Bacteroidales bacterium]|nr:T9SS type A sorting domain-containing protein [Bacteroidales bacterium]
MNKIVIFLMLLVVCGCVAGQTVNVMQREYEYDEAGNRIVRKVVILASSSTSSGYTAENPETEVFADKAGEIELLLYPNPTTAHINLEIKSNVDKIDGNVLIYNVNSAEMGEQSFSALQTEIDLSRFATGIYFITVIINGEKTTWKVVKK